MSRKKVLFIAPKNTKGGIGSVLQLYIAHLRNFDILYTYPDVKEQSRISYFIKSLISLVEKLIKDKNIDIVHIHTASAGSFYRKSIILLLSKLFTKKVILHIHGGGFKDFMQQSMGKGRLVALIMKVADLNICLSQEWHDYFKVKWALNNIAVLPNPILLPSVYIPPNKSNKLVLLFLGSVVGSKGIFDLVEFLSSYIPFKEGKIVLHIGGEGELDRMGQFVENHKLKNQIFIHGWVDAEEKKQLLTKSDIFILPSYVEGLPMSILEAMSYGKPIIATHVGGIPSLVQNQVNGWLYNPNDCIALQNIFDHLIKYPELLLAYGKSSFKMATAYDIHKIVDQLEGYYEQVSSS